MRPSALTGELPLRRARLAAVRLSLAVGGLTACASAPSLAQLDPPTLEAHLTSDTAAVLVYRAGLRSVVAYVDARPDLFARDQAGVPSIPSREARETIRAAWQRFLDYTLALDSLGRAHQGFDALPSPAREQSFTIGHAAFVAQYRFALALLDRLDRNPDLEPLLDDPVPELGLPRGTYARIRLRFLNPARATEFAALGVVSQEARRAVPALAAALLEDRDVLWRYGAGRGPVLTGTNALQVVQRASFAAWFPVQAGIADWMGDTRLGPRDRPRVSPAQVAALGAVLEPGDILLVRREGYLSNIGIPGFWPHAVLYVGTPEERRRAFAGRPEVVAWAQSHFQPDGDVEALLAWTHASAYARAGGADDGHPRRTLEAISEGVVFTTLEHAAGADHVAALRPRLPAVEKAAAILRAFGYAGRRYDFNFDFRTDAVLVCSELVYKAYEPGPGRLGLRLPLVEVLGRPVLPPSEIARLFDAELGTPGAQMDLVRFLDGRASRGIAVEGTVEAFRQSWRRPKWLALPLDPHSHQSSELRRFTSSALKWLRSPPVSHTPSLSLATEGRTQ